MKKAYKVELFSEMMDMEMNVATAEEASRIYFAGMDSGKYYRGHVISNKTGEVFHHFLIEKYEDGVRLSQWVAVE